MKKATPTEFMSVREAARYLGINEKKLYFLANANKIPSTRVTGKWIFPKQLIDRWIEESASSNMAVARGTTQRAAVLLAAGSDDPSLSVLQELCRAHEGTPSLFMATVGSSAGLQSIRSGIADFATAHLLDPARPVSGGRAAQESVPNGTVIVQLFYRELGWLVQKGNPLGIESVRDLARPEVRFVNRQPGSGTRIFLDQELARVRVNGKRIAGYDEIVSTHLEIGLRVMSGRCDVGLATRTTAQLLDLDFVPLTRERFDMLVPNDRFLTKPMQNLLSVVASREFRNRVGALGGYDVSESGRIVGST
jgi:putative molybdopterin biosynthesis protein